MAGTQLTNVLSLLDQIDLLLTEYERTNDKRTLSSATKELKIIAPQLKQLSNDPECKTKENTQKLVLVSLRMKEAVERTKVVSKRVVAASPASSDGGGAGSLVSPFSTSLPTVSPMMKTVPPRLNLMGYLCKQGNEPQANKPWKKLWFQQRDSKLLYFLSEDDSAPKGFIDLQQVLTIEVKEGVNIFELNMNYGRLYRFQVLKDADLPYWVDGLKDYIAANPKVEVAPPPPIPKLPSGKNLNTTTTTTTTTTVTPATTSTTAGIITNNEKPDVTEVEKAKPSEEEQESTNSAKNKKKTSELEHKLRDLQEKLLEKEKQIKFFQGETLNQQFQLKQKDALNQQLEEEKTKLTNITKEQEITIASLKNSSAYKLEQEFYHKEKQLDSVNVKLLEMEENLKKLEEQNKNLLELLSDLRGEMESKEKTIVSLKDQVMDLNSGGLVRGSRLFTAEVENLREAVRAHLTQNRFLLSEIKKLEADRKIIEETKNETISALLLRLEEARLEYQNFREIMMGSSSSEEYIQALETDNLNIKKEFFLSLAVSVKLNRSLQGLLSNTDIISLYERAVTQGVPFKNWPNFIASQLSLQFDLDNNRIVSQLYLQKK